MILLWKLFYCKYKKKKQKKNYQANVHNLLICESNELIIQEQLGHSSFQHDCILLDKWWHTSPFKGQQYIQIRSSAQYKDVGEVKYDILFCWPICFSYLWTLVQNNSSSGSLWT